MSVAPYQRNRRRRIVFVEHLVVDAAFLLTVGSWKLPAYSGAFLLTVDNLSFFTYSWSLFTYSFSFSTYSWSFFAYSGKVRLIKALRDCKPRSSTVSKKAPTVSEKASPFGCHHYETHLVQKMLFVLSIAATLFSSLASAFFCHSSHLSLGQSRIGLRAGFVE